MSDRRTAAGWRGGDQAALDQLMPVMHAELRRLARNYTRRERPDHTLQTSALVNEAYLLLVDAGKVDWKCRACFLAASAKLMRRVLAEYAGSRASRKKGGHVPKVQLDEEVMGRLTAWSTSFPWTRP